MFIRVKLVTGDKNLTHVSRTCYTCQELATRVKNLPHVSRTCYTCQELATRVKNLPHVSKTCYTCQELATRVKILTHVSRTTSPTHVVHQVNISVALRSLRPPMANRSLRRNDRNLAVARHGKQGKQLHELINNQQRYITDNKQRNIFLQQVKILNTIIRPIKHWHRKNIGQVIARVNNCQLWSEQGLFMAARSVIISNYKILRTCSQRKKNFLH